MNIKVVSIGGGGNKASIELLNESLLIEEDLLLINSTLRDIPADYRHLGVQYVDCIGGCGKEMDLSKQYCLDSMRKRKIDLDTFVTDDTDVVIVVATSSGGTGAGAINIICKYLVDVIGVPVIPFIFTGFEEDGRELQNTIEVFQGIEDKFTVQSISNKKFLSETTNKLKAEKLANKEFVERVKVIMGVGMRDSEQNMDETDLFKVVTTPGFMTVGHSALGKIKNKEQFNKFMSNLIDEDKSLDINEKAMVRLGIIINATEETLDNIDFSFDIIKDKLGVPYEIFTHIQYDEEQPEYINFIASGMKMPLEEIKQVYEKYKKESERVNKKQDTFFDFAGGLKGNDEDSSFNVGGKRRLQTAKKDFFNSFGITENKDSKPNEQKSEVKNKQKQQDYIKKNF